MRKAALGLLRHQKVVNLQKLNLERCGFNQWERCGIHSKNLGRLPSWMYHHRRSFSTKNHQHKENQNKLLSKEHTGGNVLVVGLGNKSFPGTRHNMGMILLDYLVSSHLELDWTLDSSAGGWTASIHSSLLFQSVPSLKKTSNTIRNVHFLKPSTFMNLSGVSAVKASKKFHISPEKMLIVHDDLDRGLGKVSFKKGGSASGHNGVKSIIQKCHTQDFPRLRVGIGRPHDSQLVEDFVLGSFTASELKMIDDMVIPMFLDQFHQKVFSLL